MATIRPASVAGHFYPDKADALKTTLAKFLNGGDNATDTSCPKALIVPHAGYAYSGDIAAAAYKQIANHAGKIKRVVLLGPCHRVAVDGIALSGADFFETPLGQIPIDKDHEKMLLSLPYCHVFEPTHRDEHSLEVQLPFLQYLLQDFSVTPVVVGQCQPQDLADALDLIWGGPETLIVVSTDLSHFLNYDACQQLDQQTIRAIEQFDYSQFGKNSACGRIPMAGLLHTAKKRQMNISTLAQCNSGDKTTRKDRVVGYGAWALSGGIEMDQGIPQFRRKTRDLLQIHGATLLHVAAASIKNGITNNKAVGINLDSFPPALKKDGASFVTINKNGKLRGCIGSLQAWQPLTQDIATNAFKAGFCDPRFPQIARDELPELTLHLSILSPAFAMSFNDEDDLLDQLTPGKDGLIIADAGRRALFLPTVWEQLPDKKTFLTHLRRKAGLAAHHWSDNFQAWRFITQGISSEQLDDPAVLWQDQVKPSHSTQ